MKTTVSLKYFVNDSRCPSISLGWRGALTGWNYGKIRNQNISWLKGGPGDNMAVFHLQFSRASVLANNLFTLQFALLHLSRF